MDSLIAMLMFLFSLLFISLVAILMVELPFSFKPFLAITVFGMTVTQVIKIRELKIHSQLKSNAK